MLLKMMCKVVYAVLLSLKYACIGIGDIVLKEKQNINNKTISSYQ